MGRDCGSKVRGDTGSMARTGACLPPGIAEKRVDFSGELYMPKTSASAAFVLMVTVGSAPTRVLRERLLRVFLVPSSLKLTCAVDALSRVSSEAGGGPHFLPRRPIERARASGMLYSPFSSVNNKLRSNRSFSGRFPGTGGASM